MIDRCIMLSCSAVHISHRHVARGRERGRRGGEGVRVRDVSCERAVGGKRRCEFVAGRGADRTINECLVNERKS